jgi:hypothetical protein
MSSLTPTPVLRAPEQWVPVTEGERRLAHEQLERILASPLFQGSKRSAKLLSFICEAVLDGRGEHLKERNLGVDVFGRECDYDTNRDPVVRTTAVDIRRRLAQYYQEPPHGLEMAITLPPGSYVPHFRPVEASSAIAEPVTEQLPIVHPTIVFPSAPVAAPDLRSRRGYFLGAAAALAGAAVFTAAGAYWTRSSALVLDQFWAPVLDTDAPVLLLIGGHGLAGARPSEPRPSSIRELQANETVSFADSTALTRIASTISVRGKRFQIRLHSQANLADLQQAPVVLIGANNNEWTLRLSRQGRFTFAHDDATHNARIIDRENPDRDRYLIREHEDYRTVEQDYAIISRVQDSTTGRIVVTAAGITKFGTAAAGEFLFDPKYLQAAAGRMPAGWQTKNIQILISTKLVGESSGPPKLLATHVW